MRPNVVVLLLDTARADAFEPYGAAPGSSPVVADLARAGAAVGSAYAPSNWTIPSHATMFTGLAPRELGFGQAPGNWGQQCRPLMEGAAERNLARFLAQAGYDTLGVSANAWISPRTGFGIGFESFRVARGRRYEGIAEPGLRARARWAKQALQAQIDDGAGAAARIVDDWLEARAAAGDRRPFFCFVNLVECHSPYLPPRPWTTMSAWQRLRAGEEARRHLTLGEIFRVNAGDFDVPDGAIERMRTGYRDAIRMMDDWIGRLVERLDQRGLLADTVVAITSDHGENLGEDGELCHAMSLADRLIRVPFVLHGPGVRAPEGPWSLAGLPALVAELADLDTHPWADGGTTDAVVAQYDGPSRHDPARAVAFAEEHGLDDAAVRKMTGREDCATDGRHKLIRSDHRGELLYDLVADPHETSPVTVTAGTEVPPGLRAALEAADEAAASAVGAAGDASELEELEGQLKLLGYL